MINDWGKCLKMYTKNQFCFSFSFQIVSKSHTIFVFWIQISLWFSTFFIFFSFFSIFLRFFCFNFFLGGGGKDRRRPVTYINHIPQERSQELFQPLFNQVCWLTASRLWGHLQWVKLGQTQNPQTTRGYPPLSHMLGLWAAGGSGHKGTPAAA